ncbi:hypothetical protein [Kordiimonas lacus]|uniref:Glyoxylase, beta-lactamase superfamily II n=1 Tax=Kordiimonas lacus TaxID=637679 RepID=A0A1G7C6J3_9PROT|nr:hypothetical protein [Kordiimonas lacus]SDE34065.1 Glyoxylase, beta-lactamase superfamily II [Kordiimonas lacus]
MSVLRVLLVVSFLFGVSGAKAQENGSPFAVHHIRDNVYVLTRLWEPGVGNNMGVVVGEDGLLLINSMMSNDSEALAATLKTIADKPVTYVLNSNWDFYNVLGNEYFAEKGAMIIAQEDVQYAPRNPSYDPVFHDLLFKDGISFRFGGDTITAYRSGGHSFPHVNIRVEKANVTFMADSFRADWFGVMGPWGLKGYFEGLDRALEGADENTVFITGGYVGDLEFSRADILREKKARQAFVDRIGALYKAGMSVDEMILDVELNRITRNTFPESFERFAGLHDYDILPTLSAEFTPSHPMSGTDMQAFTGTYQSPEGLSFEVYDEGGMLFAQSKGRFKVRLKPVSPTEFIFVDAQAGERLVFELGGQGAVVAVRPELGESHLARRIPAGRWLKQ